MTTVRSYIAATAAAAVLCATLGAFAPAAGRESTSPRAGEMAVQFFSSAVCFHFPDGGAMLIDIGRGTNPDMMRLIRERMVGNAWVYRFLAFFGWRPRIDWLILIPRENEWDDSFANLINVFDVLKIYVPFDVRRIGGTSRGEVLHEGLARMVLQISLSARPTANLAAGKTVDLVQSVSDVVFEKILPREEALFDRPEGPFCARIRYNRVRILVLGELAEADQRRLVSLVPESIRADIVYHAPGASPEFLRATGAAVCIPHGGEYRSFVTDGSLF